MEKNLSPRQEIFVKEYLKGTSATSAAIAAGYSPASAKFQGSALIRKCPAVMAAIDSAQSEFREERKFTVGCAVMEAETLASLAIESKQYSVATKLLELKCKLHGLLIEKRETKTTDINIAKILEDARGRLNAALEKA